MRFGRDSIVEIHKIMGNSNSPLTKDFQLVEGLITEIDNTLKRQLNGIVADADQIEVAASEIGEQFAIDVILMNSACYQKNYKYQNSVSRLIAKKAENENDIADSDQRMRANQELEELIERRNYKIKIWTDLLRKNRISDVHKTFLKFLNHERSILLIWLLTQRLHQESKQNPVWRRLLLS